MYGIVVIDVSSKFLHISNHFEKINNELREIALTIRRLISKDYSSVSRVLLILDSFEMSHKPGTEKLSCSRIGLFIRHLKQSDSTEDGIALDLLATGIPKENIVLGCHQPKIRQYTEFAIA
jgi:XisI protein